MNYKLPYILLFFLFFATFFASGKATAVPDDEPIQKVEVPKKNIEEYRKDADFDYTIEIEKQDNFIIKFFHWIVRIIKKFFMKVMTYFLDVKSATSVVAFILRMLPYLLILVFVYIIFKYLLGIDLIRMRKRKNAKMPVVDLSDDEQIIMHQDLKQLIADAIANKDYRLAIRYYYLSTLKQLIEKEYIDWKPEKTNRDYIIEMQNRKIAPDFKKLTYIYDYVWYGNFGPNSKEFDEITADFNRFNKIK